MADEFKTHRVAVTTAGSAGSAVGEAQTGNLSGLLWDVWIDFHASAPASTIVTISYPAYTNNEGVAIPARGNILVTPAGATDKRYTPRMDYTDDAGTVIGQQPLPVLDNCPIRVALSASNALTDAAVVYLTVLEA